MNNDNFEKIVKMIVSDYFNNRSDKTDFVK